MILQTNKIIVSNSAPYKLVYKEREALTCIFVVDVYLKIKDVDGINHKA